LEYDAAFAALERAAAGEPEKISGDKTIPAVPPRWPEVGEAARELMGRSRDLRVVGYLTRAAVNTEGLVGLASGLKLVQGLLETFWDSVHPQLDKEDNNDPTLRLNSIAVLGKRDLMGKDSLLASVTRAPIVESKSAGRYSLRSIRLSKGEGSPVGDEALPDSSLIDAAFMDCDVNDLTAKAAAVDESLAALGAISAFIRDRVEVGPPDFEGLENDLKEIRAVLAPQLLRRGVGVEASAEAGGEAQGGAGASAVVGEIRSRDDAVRMLDKISDYFRRNEPSSPVPILLQRAKRLVSMDFMEILRDLTPNGVSQAEIIAGSLPGDGQQQQASS
jgi:type VI secretion system protein ImpA